MTTHEVLKRLEWQESELGPRCPLCKSYQPRGHREGCEMQAAIERESTRSASRASYPLPLPPVHVYATGICNASVCAASGLSLEEILRRVNGIHPSGTAHGWAKSPSETFATGQSNPCACQDHPGRIHFLLEC